MAKVAINGLGRIGRAACKIILDTPEMELVAVNDLVPPENLAYLLNYDTVYGRYEKRATSNGDHLDVAGQKIRVLNEMDPAQLPWADLGVETVFECTGIFKKKADMQKHLQAGAKRVILSAPGKDEDLPFVVYGVNQAEAGTEMLSCASCTTNCITPFVEIISRRIGIEKAIMTTIHGYTSSQKIVDGPSKKFSRGRAGAANLVPTTTGAAKATTRVLTALEGRFDGMAVRAPVPIGSIADITFITSKPTSVEEVNAIFKEEAASDRYKEAVGVTEDPIVSSDIIQDPHGSLIDLGLTQVVDGNLLKVMSWYDNEWGYAAQMVREAARLQKV